MGRLSHKADGDRLCITSICYKGVTVTVSIDGAVVAGYVDAKKMSLVQHTEDLRLDHNHNLKPKHVKEERQKISFELGKDP